MARFPRMAPGMPGVPQGMPPQGVPIQIGVNVAAPFTKALMTHMFQTLFPDLEGRDGAMRQVVDLARRDIAMQILALKEDPRFSSARLDGTFDRMTEDADLGLMTLANDFAGMNVFDLPGDGESAIPLAKEGDTVDMNERTSEGGIIVPE